MIRQLSMQKRLISRAFSTYQNIKRHFHFENIVVGITLLFNMIERLYTENCFQPNDETAEDSEETND